MSKGYKYKQQTGRCPHRRTASPLSGCAEGLSCLPRPSIDDLSSASPLPFPFEAYERSRSTAGEFASEVAAVLSVRVGESPDFLLWACSCEPILRK